MLWFISNFNKLAVQTLQSYSPEHAPSLTLIYGSTGIGKTELLRSTYNKLRNHKHVIYMNAETFSKSYAYSSQEGNLSDFRQRIRSASLLVFDQLEKLRGKTHTIEEFLHTYEALMEQGAKMIVGFQGEISELSFLGEKLSSRMLGGLAIRIESPSQAEMVDYISRYTRSRFLIIEHEVLEGIAQEVSNFSQAQTYIQGFIDYANEVNSALDFEAFTKYQTYRSYVIQRIPTPETILRQVAIHQGVKPEEMIGALRQTRIREARQLAMYLIRNLCHFSYPEIGAYFNKAHSAVIKSCQQVESRMKTDLETKTTVETITTYFREEDRSDK